MEKSVKRVRFSFADVYLYEWNDLYYSELDIDVGIHALQTLYKNQEKSLERTTEDFQETLKKAFTDLDPEEQALYYSQWYEREDRMINELRRQQRNAIILSIFSFIEGRLRSICNQIEKRFDYKIKINDLGGGDDLKRYWNYLIKVYELDPSSATQFFTYIYQQKTLRNIIAHQDGIIKEDQKGKINTSLGLAIIQIYDEMQVEIRDPQFILDLLEKIKNFFDKLLRAIDMRYKQLNPQNE